MKEVIARLKEHQLTTPSKWRKKVDSEIIKRTRIVNS